MNQHEITKILTQTFQPTHLEIEDDSSKHRHHQGTHHTENTHFNVVIVSDTFVGMSLIKRHRAINTALKPAFEGTLHALKITAKTPAEWHQ